MDGRKEEYEKMITTLQIPLTEGDRTFTDKHFLKIVMSKWLPGLPTASSR